ncbi:MAG: hypothetical protein U0798_03985 [Gemmataceae bacterium]
MRIHNTILAFLSMTGSLLGWVASPNQARAQDVEDVLIETYDGVNLRARQYKAASSSTKNNACVIVMHAYQKEPTKGDLNGLSKELAKEGYHVIQFDFRFHGGKPTDVIPGVFWNEYYNKQYITGATRRPARSELTLKDIRNAKEYYPMLVNDIMAVRTYLDVQNDLGKVNTSSVYLVGCGDAVCNGFVYLTSEFYREREVPNVPIPPTFVSANRTLFPANAQSCGQDIAGAIWLSPVRHQSMSQNTLENLTTNYRLANRLREIPMLFVSGEKDSKGKEGAKFFFDKVLVAQPRSGSSLAKLPLTYNREIKGTNLTDAELLGKGLDTEKTIIEFMTAVDKDRKNKVAVPKRGYTKPLPVQFKSFGIN